MAQVERYWIFALFCLLLGGVVLRLILRERISLQGSLSFLALLFLMSMVGLFPGAALRVAQAVGFTLPSNFFFAIAIAALGLLHISVLITMSRLELRSVTLTQELAILNEKLDQAIRSGQS